MLTSDTAFDLFKGSINAIQCKNRTLNFFPGGDFTPCVMGVLNITPDSFSDGGRFLKSNHQNLNQIVDAAAAMLEAGARIIDVGGESTRPGASPVSPAEELDRVIPVIESLSQLDGVISVDTSNPQVMTAAAKAGASLINDVRALQKEGALQAASATGLPVVIMHTQGEPAVMQNNPSYTHVVDEVFRFLQTRKQQCQQAGIEQIIVDPGFGFGKNLQHNLALFQSLQRFHQLGSPLMVGLSRKSMLGQITGQPVDKRANASAIAGLLAAQKGAAILRVHDVQETIDGLKIWQSVK